MFEPLLAGVYSVPIILFLPLYVLFFGLGPGSKIALGTTISFFPIVLNTIAGFGYVDKIFITAARSMGASDVQMFRYVLLPAALPVILTGLAHRLHRGAAVDPRQRDHRLARRPRPSHRASRRGDGDGADVRLHRLRRGDRGVAQHRRQLARTPGQTPMSERAAARSAHRCCAIRRWRGLPWWSALFAAVGGRGALVDRSDVPQPAVAGAGARSAICSTPRACRRRCGSPFWELAVAFAISVVIGLAVGLAVGLSRFSNRSLMPIILLLYGTPQITILPLFILYFGIGPASKIAFGVSHGIFPIIVTIVAGVQNIKPILMTAAHSMGASRWQIFRWVIFPHMIPTFFAGMRLGMTGVLLGVLLAELYVSTAGIGYFTQLFTQSVRPDQAARASISVLAAMAIVAERDRAARRGAFRPLADRLAARHRRLLRLMLDSRIISP